MAVDFESENFGGTLYRLRSQRGMAQSETASRAGLTRGYYSQVENSRKGPPPPQTLLRIAAALNLSDTQTYDLQLLASAEKCTARYRTEDVPLLVSRVVKNLLLAAPNIPTDKLHRIEAILKEN